MGDPMTTLSHPNTRARSDEADLALTDLERCLLRLGRVQVDTRRASSGRAAVTALAARGFLATSTPDRNGAITGTITPAGRRALAWADGEPPTRLN